MARKLGPQRYHGMLLVNKPYAMVSKDVSRWLEKRLGRLKIGHVGTLDPLAKGLLPILLGRATRLQDFLLDLPKGYQFEVTLGTTTETMDSAGEVVSKMAFDHVTEEALAAICSRMVGRFTQVPPLYSAIKFQGKPLYWYARQGKAEEVDLESFKKNVDIHSLEFLSLENGKAKFEVVCSKGTYVRTLAAAIAEGVGSCGYVSELIRFQAAGYDLDKAWDLDQIEDSLDAFENCLIGIENIDLALPKWEISDPILAKRLKMGQKMQVDRYNFEKNLQVTGSLATGLDSIDNILLLDNHKRSFGIGNAIAQKTGRMAIQMRRGLS